MRAYAHGDDETAFDEVDPTAYASEDEYWNSDDAPAMAATVGAILRDDPPRGPADWKATITDHLERSDVFWLKKVVCEDPDHLGLEMPGFDELHIEADEAFAEMTGLPISAWSASRIASQLHEGQGSYLYSFASSGAIDTIGLLGELVRDIRSTTLDPVAKRWAKTLAVWLADYHDRRPVPNWHERTGDQQAPFLGRVATSVTSMQ